MNTLRFENYKDYILFLYIHIAFADGVVQPEEKELILNRLNKYFKDPKEAASKFEAMLEIYQENSNNVTEVIRESHKNFPNIQFYKKYKVFLDLYDIINADGIIEEDETKAIEKLKSIIEFEVE